MMHGCFEKTIKGEGYLLAEDILQQVFILYFSI